LILTNFVVISYNQSLFAILSDNNFKVLNYFEVVVACQE
jgi:hypothetical protein